MKKKKWMILFVIVGLIITSLFINQISKNINYDNNKQVVENINHDNSTTNLIGFNYKFNPHVISKEYLITYGNDIENIFYDFYDAVLNGESNFKCDTKEKLNSVISISTVCLPIASECIQKDKCYVEDEIGYIFY